MCDLNKLSSDLTKTLIIDDSALVDDKLPSFIPYYVYVMNEKDAAMESGDADYEMQLYRDYVEREGELPDQSATKSVSSGKKPSTKSDDQYEKVKVKHGDQMFHRFHKQIRKCPGQCLRFVF